MSADCKDLVERARDHWRRGDNQVAERLLRRAAEKDATPCSKVFLGDFLNDTSFPEEAEGIFRELIKDHPDNPDIHVRLARSLILQERFEPAWTALERALEIKPLHSESLQILVEIARRTGRVPEAVERLENLAGDFPLSPEPFLALASIHQLENRLDRAARVLAHGLRTCPANPFLLNRLGIINYNKGRYRASLRCYGRAIEKIPAECRCKEYRPYHHIRMNLANALCMAGQINESLEIYENLLAENPGDVTTGINLAITLRRANRLKEARRVLEVLLSNGAGSHDIYYWLGVICAEDGALQHAEQNFRKALALNGADNSLKLNLAFVLKSLDRLPEAVDLAEDVLYLNPDHREALQLKAEILIELEKPEEAAAIYRTLHSEDPGDAVPLHRLGMIEATRGRFDSALRYLKRSLELAPRAKGKRLDTAEVLLINGRDEECLDVLAQGLEEGVLSIADIRSHPGLDDIKTTDAYRAMTGGSLLDFADPWGGAEKRLLELAAALPVSSPATRESCRLWHDLESRGTLEGDAGAVVGHVLKEVTDDMTLAKSMNRSRQAMSFHAEVHPLDGGLEIRTVYYLGAGEEEACTLSQVLFRLDDSSFLVRSHDQACLL
jgi:tetratricopeptide (TPR) repeat protein